MRVSDHKLEQLQYLNCLICRYFVKGDRLQNYSVQARGKAPKQRVLCIAAVSVYCRSICIAIRYTGLLRAGRCLRMLWQIQELDVLDFLLPVIKVPVEVRSVLLPTLALAAPVLTYTLRIKNS